MTKEQKIIRAKVGLLELAKRHCHVGDFYLSTARRALSAADRKINGLRSSMVALDPIRYS